MMSKDTVTINGIEHDLYPVGRIEELEADVQIQTRRLEQTAAVSLQRNKRIAELEGDVVSLQLMEKSLIQYCKDHKAHIKALQAKLEAVLNCKEVMWKRMDGKYEPYFLKADVLKALQEQEAGCKVCGLPEWDHHHGDERHEYKQALGEG
jgi:hypothetical protein